MTEDPRCCGSGTCIIDQQGRCWCGQQWDGQKMNPAPLATTPSPAHGPGLRATTEPPARPEGSDA